MSLKSEMVYKGLVIEAGWQDEGISLLSEMVDEGLVLLTDEGMLLESEIVYEGMVMDAE